MKTTIKMKRFLSQCFVIFFCLFAMHGIAQADALNDFASFLDQLGWANPFQSEGISGTSIRQAEALFTCIDQGDDVIVCIDKAKDTDLGQKLTAGSGIPSWAWYLIDCYVALKEGDVWYFIEKLGLAVVCAVMQFFTTVDICGLIEELYEIAKGAVEAAEQIYGWFKDVGEALWDAATGALCALTICCCDDPPPPPPAEDLAYAEFFAPKVSNLDGLKAIEDKGDSKYSNLKNTQTGYAWQKYGSNAASIAAKRFDDAVDTQWTADLTSKVLPELSGKRSTYGTPQQIAALAQQNWEDQWPLNPSNTIPFHCREDFKTQFGYAHVDRWIYATKHKDMAQSLNLKTNQQWCQDVFWNDNKQKFATIFTNYVQSKCPATGGKLLCSSFDDLNRCKTFMKDFGKDGQCDFTPASALQGKCPLSAVTKTRLCASPDDYLFCLKTLSYFNQQSSCSFTPAVAYKAGQIIAAEFTARGSNIPCDIKTGSEAGKPADFVCKRPKQVKNCASINGQKFGNLPKPLVNCAPYNDPAYDTLRNQVKQVVAGLNAKYNGIIGIYEVMEPLYVYTQITVPAPPQLKIDIAKNFGFGPPSSKPGFIVLTSDDPHVTIPFDGLSTPVAGVVTKVNSSAFMPGLTGVDMEKKLEDTLKKGGKPGRDPIDQLSLEKGKDLEKLGSAAMGGAGLKDKVPGAQPGMLASGKDMGQVTKEMGAQFGTQQETKPMSLELLPDITADLQVSITGRTVSWSSTINVATKDALHTMNGLCAFAIQYTVRNTGKAPTGTFKSAWYNSAVPGTWERSWPVIAPGASSTQTDTISLKPGQNTLTLLLDPTNQVKKSNKSSNQFIVQVTVSGTCSDMPKDVAPSSPMRRH